MKFYFDSKSNRPVGAVIPYKVINKSMELEDLNAKQIRRLMGYGNVYILGEDGEKTLITPLDDLYALEPAKGVEAKIVEPKEEEVKEEESKEEDTGDKVKEEESKEDTDDEDSLEDLDDYI